MAMSADTTVNKDKEAKKLVFLLRPSTIFTVIFLSMTALVLAYIAGVMSGRHGVGKQLIAVESQKEKASVADSSEKKQQEVLAPEELDFARVLKGQSARSKQEKSKTASVATREENLEVQASSDDDAGKVPVEKNSENLPDSESVFDYLVQMAAFRDELTADNLREKLEGEGYRTVLQRNGKMLIVLVKMRGTANNLNALFEFARKIKLGEPVLRESKSVNN